MFNYDEHKKLSMRLNMFEHDLTNIKNEGTETKTHVTTVESIVDRLANDLGSATANLSSTLGIMTPKSLFNEL